MSTHSAFALTGWDASTARGLWLRWLPTFVGFIAGGALAIAVTGPVDSLPAAVGGGALAGAVIGAAQWLVLRTRLPNAGLPDAGVWIAATAVGQAVGLAAGAALVGYQTGLRELAVQGLVTGLAIGVLQALVLRPRVAGWFWWAIAMPPLWALGWIVTSSAGVGVDQQFVNFGATGAIVVTVLSGLLLVQLLRVPRPVGAAALPTAGGAL